MDIRSVPLVGIPNDGEWPTIMTQEVSTGKFFLSLAIQDDPQASEHGRAIIEELQKILEEDSSDARIQQFFLQPFAYPLHIAGGIVRKESLFCFAGGDASVRLYSNGQEQSIVTGNETTPLFMQGKLRDGNDILFATAAFFTNCQSRPQPHQSLQEFADLCAVTIQTSPQSSKIACIGVRFSSEEKPTIPESLPQTPSSEGEKKEESPIPVVRPKLDVQIHWQTLLRKHRKIGSYIVIFLLFLSAYLIVSQFTRMQRERRVSSYVAPYQDRFAKAKEEVKNNKLEGLSQLRSLQKDLEARVKEAQKDKALKDATEEQLRQVLAVYAQYSGEKHIEKLQVYYDFRLVSQDFVAGAVAYDKPGKQAVFLDSGHKKLLSLSLEKKQPQVLSVDQKLQNPLALTVVNRKAYVLGKEGVVELSLPLDQIGRTAAEPSGLWQTPHLIGSFGTNLYILDTGLREMYRYDLEDAQASPSAWFRSKEGIAFDDIASVMIDGDVWFTQKDGAILRYTRGEKTGFSVQGLLDAFSSTLSLFTQEGSERLYVLEPHQKRIVVLSKQGEYQSAVYSQDLGTASSLIVDEDVGKAYVLAGSLVYEVPLQ